MVTIDRDGKEIDEIEVYENKIEELIEDYCLRYDVENMRQASSLQWSAAMIHVYKKMFKNQNSKSLYRSKLNYNNGYLINELCDIYIELCCRYDKLNSIMDFCRLTGIHRDTVYSWGNGEYRSYIYYDYNDNVIDDIESYRLHHGEPKRKEMNFLHSDVFKKLQANREDLIKSQMISSKTGQVAYMYILNNEYGYNTQGALLPTIAAHTASREQIGSKYQDAEKPQLPDFDND